MDEGFAWKTGLKHAGLALCFVLVLGVASFAMLDAHVASPEKMGEGVGRFAAFTSLAALGVSWAWQTGRPRLAKIAIGLWVALVAAVAAMVTASLAG